MSIDATSETILLEAVPRGRARTRGTIIAIVGAVLLLAAAGAVFALLKGGEAQPAPGALAADYVEVPPMIVNLRSADGKARFLKLRFIIVATDAGHGEEIRARLPVLLDALQPFLRELRPEDLNGSAAIFRVKEEMMARATSTIGAAAVRDVLIQDLIQQ